MTTKNTRYKKIRNLILENAQYGLDRCVDTLNDNGFSAPCGRKRYWKTHQVQSILKGEMYEVEKISVATKVTKSQHAAIKKSGLKVATFLREAIKDKLIREGLV
ncbi:hypothetical protein KAR91_32120 [Candidatus Pacearchaeota archaeon]|nr:hypothetical protein [Candidatus Pacearchaeota archaeon]